MLLLLRFAIAALGVAMFVMITNDLLDGEISYGIGGELLVEPVTTQTLAEALAIWAAFSSLFVGLIILGLWPHLYVERRWLWKVLLTTLLVGYGAADLLRLQSHASYPAMRNFEVVMTALGLVVLLAGLWLTLKPLRIGFASRNWPDVVGKIIESGKVSAGTDDGGEPLFNARVIYRYAVGGCEYQGSMIRTLPSVFGTEYVQQVPELYPVGSEVIVFYDPSDPQTSILEPGVSTGTQVGMLIYVAVCVMLAAKIVVYLWVNH
jgi:hypothetical protein